MSNAIDKYKIITFSIVNNPYPCHPYMFITENYSSKFTIISFWAPAPKSPAEINISQKISGYVTDNRKYTIRDNSTIFTKSLSTLAKNYHKFCAMSDLEKLI